MIRQLVDLAKLRIISMPTLATISLRVPNITRSVMGTYSSRSEGLFPRIEILKREFDKPLVRLSQIRPKS